jgi:hypothetical protein
MYSKGAARQKNEESKNRVLGFCALRKAIFTQKQRSIHIYKCVCCAVGISTENPYFFIFYFPQNLPKVRIYLLS